MCFLSCKLGCPMMGLSSGEVTVCVGHSSNLLTVEKRCPTHTDSEIGKGSPTQSSHGPWTSLQDLVHRINPQASRWDVRGQVPDCPEHLLWTALWRKGVVLPGRQSSLWSGWGFLKGGTEESWSGWGARKAGGVPVRGLHVGGIRLLGCGVLCFLSYNVIPFSCSNLQ